ncbi:MAG: IS110 family transposase [Prevotella sp.]|jgi:transposase|nr:IS110 family transposase [Prevotella sp.]
MKKKYYLGIDVSKKKLDVCLMTEGKIIKEEIVMNHIGAIQLFLEDLFKELSIARKDLFICCEHTGQYTYPLRWVCQEHSLDIWVENPAQIKHRGGVQRGKNDSMDAYRIAIYAIRFEDKACLCGLPQDQLQALKSLIAEQNLLVADKAKYKGQLSDQGEYMDKTIWASKLKRLRYLIVSLDKTIDEIQQQIDNIINNDDQLYKQMQLLKSVDGIGDKTALKMIVETDSFKRFTNARKFCCHAGVAPFSYSSGSSIRSKTKVSHRADKSIKTLLHMAALSVLQRKGELRDYYLRKVAEGKSKMTVINAIRAKLIFRMFAVIKNDKFYQPIYTNSFA